MLQRIQTIYLLIIFALEVALLFLPIATIQAGTDFFSFNVLGLTQMGAKETMAYSTLGLTALTLASAILALVTIFKYKKRLVQIRLSVINMFLLVGFYVLFAVFAWITYGKFNGTHFGIEVALAFPFVNIILTYLAIGKIGADEALVRSLDRLR